MRTLMSMLVLLAGLAAVSAAVPGRADAADLQGVPVVEQGTAPGLAPAQTSPDGDERADYAAREAASADLERFEGGGHADLYIVGGCSCVVILILLIILI